MWKDLSAGWQAAFEEAWVSFRNGSIPIGAAVLDDNGDIIIREHNRSAEPGTVNKKTAHAEANALHRLDTSLYSTRDVVLYTTMEPCPMCMGTAVMSNIEHLRYAARDPHCGCIHWKENDPYISGKDLDYTHEGGEPGFVQLVIQSCFEMGCIEKGCSDTVLKEFAALDGNAVRTAEKLYNDKILEGFALNGTGMDIVYDTIVLSR